MESHETFGGNGNFRADCVESFYKISDASGQNVFPLSSRRLNFLNVRIKCDLKYFAAHMQLESILEESRIPC